MYRNLAIIAVVVIVILILRSISETKIGMPEGAGDDVPDPRPDTGNGFDAFDGEVEGVEYTVEMYSDDEISIEIDLDDPPETPREIDVRDGGKHKLDPSDPLRQEAEALIAMGAGYIEVGYNADIVGAVFPASMKIDRAFAEKVVRRLIALGEKAA